MAASASVRHGFRWQDNEFSEPTNTLALNVGDYFVDLRTFVKDGSIEWAMAGKRAVLQQDPLKVQWTRHIDSLGEPGAVDEGDFRTLENGDDLEYGSMVSPDHGNASTYYEEIWRDGPLAQSKAGSWIAESVEGSEGTATRGRTWIGRVGGYYLAMREVDSKSGKFEALRQEWDVAGKAWGEKYSSGAGTKLPYVEDVESKGVEGLDVGSQFTVDGLAYVLKGRAD